MRFSRRRSATRDFWRGSNGSLREAGWRCTARNEWRRSVLPCKRIGAEEETSLCLLNSYPPAYGLRCRRRSESKVHRETGRPSPEVDLVPEEIFVEQSLAFGLLVAQFSARREHIPDREPNATEHHGTRGPATVDEPAGEREAGVV